MTYGALSAKIRALYGKRLRADDFARLAGLKNEAELLEVTDLVMLDLKQMNDEIHQNLVGVSNHRTLEFAQYLAKKNINVWIRYVVVPGWSDDDDSAHRLGEFTRDMGNVEKIELLPYHELGKHKWVAMGEEYKLDGVHPPKKETMERVKGILEQYGHKVMY